MADAKFDFSGMLTCARCYCTFVESETTKGEVQGIDLCPNCGEVSDVFPSDDGDWNRDGHPSDDGTSSFWRWKGARRPKRKAKR